MILEPTETNPLTRLDDYLRKRDTEAEAAAYEDELFARAVAGDAPELGFHAGFEKSLRAMNEAGTLDLWLTAKDVERVMKSGARVKTIVVDPSAPEPVDASDDFDILITRVPLDLTGVRRLDVDVRTPEGMLLKTMPEALFDPADKAIYGCCEAELARTAAAVPSRTEFWATGDDGQRRLLATIHL